jgi:hypothetical protein
MILVLLRSSRTESEQSPTIFSENQKGERLPNDYSGRLRNFFCGFLDNLALDLKRLGGGLADKPEIDPGPLRATPPFCEPVYGGAPIPSSRIKNGEHRP